MRFDLLLAPILEKETLRFLKIPTASLSANTIGQTVGDFQLHIMCSLPSHLTMLSTSCGTHNISYQVISSNSYFTKIQQSKESRTKFAKIKNQDTLGKIWNRRMICKMMCNSSDTFMKNAPNQQYLTLIKKVIKIRYILF